MEQAAAKEGTTVYRTLKPGDPMYNFVRESEKLGWWVCNSADHNSDKGCSNPDCFKFKGRKKK
jgi:hypothetical protein